MGTEGSPTPLACVSCQFFPNEGLVSPRSPGPWQVGVELAEVSVPPGASCRHLSLPALQPWLRAGGREAQLVSPGKKDLPDLLSPSVSARTASHAAFAFRMWWHLLACLPSSKWSLKATYLSEIKEGMCQVGSLSRSASTSFLQWDTDSSCPEPQPSAIPAPRK